MAGVEGRSARSTHSLPSPPPLPAMNCCESRSLKQEEVSAPHGGGHATWRVPTPLGGGGAHLHRRSETGWLAPGRSGPRMGRPEAHMPKLGLNKDHPLSSDAPVLHQNPGSAPILTGPL